MYQIQLCELLVKSPINYHHLTKLYSIVRAFAIQLLAIIFYKLKLASNTHKGNSDSFYQFSVDSSNSYFSVLQNHFELPVWR